MRQYLDCYIAFLDIIGFKNLIDHSECEEILRIYDRINEKNFLSTYLGQVIMLGTPLPNSLVPDKSIKYKIMSDSICIYIEANIPNALIELIAVCSYFQASMLNLDIPVLIRGAIVRGELYAKDDIMFGKGLTQAYQLEEKVAKVPRIIIPTEIIETYENCDKPYFNLQRTFTQKEEDYFYTVNFLMSLIMVASMDKSKDRIIELIKYVNHQLNIYFDPSIREKYLYLKKWLNLYVPGEHLK